MLRNDAGASEMLQRDMLRAVDSLLLAAAPHITLFMMPITLRCAAAAYADAAGALLPLRFYAIERCR